MAEVAPARKKYMDVLKALGVLAVVLAHSAPPETVVQTVSTYYIALFFFASGYFWNEDYTASPKLLLSRRLRPLHASFVMWNLGYLALHNAFFRLNLYSSQTGYMESVSAAYGVRETLGTALGIVTLQATEQMAGALWFLISLITASAIFGLISALVRPVAAPWTEPLRFVGVLLCFAIGYSNQQVLVWPAFLNTSLVATLVLYAGLWFRRVEDRVPVAPVLAALAACVVLVGRGTVNMGANTYAGPAIFVVVVAAGIYANLFAAKHLEDSRLLNYIGRNTIFVMATHFLAFKLVSVLYVLVHGLPIWMIAKFPVVSGENGWWLLYFMCGFLVPVAFKLGLDATTASAARMTRSRTPAGSRV